jgi:hypothetical protein
MPLWLRLPRARLARQRAEGWASGQALPVQQCLPILARTPPANVQGVPRPVTWRVCPPNSKGWGADTQRSQNWKNRKFLLPAGFPQDEGSPAGKCSGARRGLRKEGYPRAGC